LRSHIKTLRIWRSPGEIRWVGRDMSRGPAGISAPLPTRRPPQPPTYQALRAKRRAGTAHRHVVRYSLARRYEEAAGVLRITRLPQKGRGRPTKPEGEIVGAWVGAARDACAVRGRRPRRLDLAAVTYVDAAGVQWLRDLMAAGVEIASC